MFLPSLDVLPFQNSLRDVVDPADGHAEVSLCAVAAAAAVVRLSRGLTNQDLRYGRRKGDRGCPEKEGNDRSSLQIKRLHNIQFSCSGWPTGYGKKLSRSQAQLGQTTCLAVA